MGMRETEVFHRGPSRWENPPAHQRGGYSRALLMKRSRTCATEPTPKIRMEWTHSYSPQPPPPSIFMSSSLIAMAQFPDTRNSAAEFIHPRYFFFNQREGSFLNDLFSLGYSARAQFTRATGPKHAKNIWMEELTHFLKIIKLSPILHKCRI